MRFNLFNIMHNVFFTFSFHPFSTQFFYAFFRNGDRIARHSKSPIKYSVRYISILSPSIHIKFGIQMYLLFTVSRVFFLCAWSTLAIAHLTLSFVFIVAPSWYYEGYYLYFGNTIEKKLIFIIKKGFIALQNINHGDSHTCPRARTA